MTFNGADRIGYTVFNQIQHSKVRTICMYFPEAESLDCSCLDCRQIKWNKGQVPIAKRILKLRVATIDRNAFYAICTIASLGIILTIAFLAFNLHFRKLKQVFIFINVFFSLHTCIDCILQRAYCISA